MRLIEPPIAGQVFAGTGGSRKVVSVKKRSDRMNDYNIEWQRPDNDWRSTVMWLPYWARWVRTAKLVSSNDARPAVGGPVERMVRPGSEAHWYCVDAKGMAQLCTVL